jgi:hypothetical protein
LRVDDAIEEALLGVVGPGAIAAATAATKEAGERRDQVRGALRRDREAARYAADRAFRQYDASDPANRLVASELEARWNRALVHAAEVEGKLAAHDARTPAPAVAPASLGVLASNLRTVWSAPTTDARVKKRIVRTLIHEVVADIDDGTTHGGIPFGRGALYYVLSNHFYIGEVKYKNEILPGEQPPIMDRALFDAVRQKSLTQWSHRTIARNKSDHLLAGLLFDDAGHRMVPTHATKAGVRYRYYVSTPVLHGEAKTASAGSVSRVPAADIEDVVVKCLKEHLAARQDKSTTSAVRLGDRDDLAQLIAGIVVHNDRLIVRLKSDNADQASDSADDQCVSIP